LLDAIARHLATQAEPFSNIIINSRLHRLVVVHAMLVDVLAREVRRIAERVQRRHYFVLMRHDLDLHGLDTLHDLPPIN
jgi:hypothetical protein